MAAIQDAGRVSREDIATFRRFARFYTRFIGTLQEEMLDSPFSMTEVRVLYEIATRPRPRARDLTESLGMDPGYLSRLLAKFEHAKLLKRTASEQDSRSVELALTRQGRAAFDQLNKGSEARARDTLKDVPPPERGELMRSMRSVENILTSDSRERASLILRPHRIGDMGWIVFREGTVYAEEYGWDQSVEALVARIVADFVTNFDADRERCWIADLDGQPVGHIFLVKHPDEPGTAKLRLLFVEPHARGLGLGAALVGECVRFARVSGYRKIVLWTQSILVSAHRLYERAGFRLVHEEPHHSFGKDLIGQTWSLDLA